MPNRSQDWLAQAERDLAHARLSGRSSDHEWACFAAQQSAQNALKALHYSHGQEAQGPTVSRLLNAWTDSAPAELVDKARVLDSHYISARSPNNHAAGAPFENYGPIQSQQAIAYAGEILAYVRAQMAAPR